MTSRTGDETKYPLDALDRRLIVVLVRDSRISMRSLAEKTHISRAHAYVRVERLQREGVIRGFTTQIEHSKAGCGSSAFVSLTIEQGSWRGLAHQLRSLCWVDHFALLGADFDVLILVRAPDNSTLRRLVLEQLQNLEGVRSRRHGYFSTRLTGRGHDGCKSPRPPLAVPRGRHAIRIDIMLAPTVRNHVPRTSTTSRLSETLNAVHHAGELSREVADHMNSSLLWG